MLTVRSLLISRASAAAARYVHTTRLLRKDITTPEEFESDVLQSKKPVLVDFHATYVYTVPSRQVFNDIHNNS